MLNWCVLVELNKHFCSDCAFFFVILQAVTRFAASNMLITKNVYKGRHLTYGKTFWHKTMHLLLETCGLSVFLIIDKVSYVLAQREERNLMCSCPLFPSFKILLVFFRFFYRIFFSTLLVYQRKILYQVLECVLGGVAVSIGKVLRSLKRTKYYGELLKVEYRIFLGASQNLATRILQ